jgi:archaellum component FlaG (FlaF/FlaG flagellin family)
MFAAVLVVAIAALNGACSSSSPSPASATPEPTAGTDSAAIIAAFLDIVDDPDLTMHVVADGTVTVFGGGQEQALTIQMEMDVSGEDGVGEASLDLGPSNIDFEMLLVDGRAYIDNNGEWTPLPDYEQTTPLNPFVNFSGPDDVEYLGAERRDGQQVHRLTSELWVGADLATLEDQGWRNAELVRNQTAILVDDSGAPVLMEFTAKMTGSYQRTQASMDFDVSYEFSDVGDPVDIPEP